MLDQRQFPPYLATKPKLDIILEVHDIHQTVEQLSRLEYQYKGEWNIPGKYGFTKRGSWISICMYILKGIQK